MRKQGGSCNEQCQVPDENVQERAGNSERKHPDRPPPPIIRVIILDLHPGFASLNLKSPPVRFADRDVTSGTEKQRCVGKKGSEYCDPNPDVLTNKLFCFVLVADPTPKLSPKLHKYETCGEDIIGRTYSDRLFVEGESVGMNRHADSYEESNK